MAFVYWLHLEKHKDMLKDGYIGVTPNLQKRIREHKHKFKSIWNEIVVETIETSDLDTCYELEKKLRPSRNIGWNIAPGGFRNNIMFGVENPNFGKVGKDAPNYKGAYICPLGRFERPMDISKIYQIAVSTVIRKCKGRFANGRFLQPQDGWAFEQKV